MPSFFKHPDELRRLHGTAPSNPPWFAPGPGLNPDIAPSFTQQRRFTNWQAYLAYLEWRDHCRDPFPYLEGYRPQ